MLIQSAAHWNFSHNACSSSHSRTITTTRNTNSNSRSNSNKMHTSASCRKWANAMLWLHCACLFLLLSNVQSTNAVPMSFFIGNNFDQPLLQRNIREVSIATQQATAAGSTEISSSGSGSTSTSDQSTADQCLIDGVLMARANVFCEPQMGCRAIQKTGHCCPDYKCDCERDGKVYANGDKLVDPETPCTVCYCKGGEILCSSVTCFQRNDCTPKFIPGRCCPEYDNCPVVVSESSTNTNWTQSTLPVSNESSSTPLPDVASQPQQDDKLKITIKEITKPTEIRMSNKVVPIQHQLSKSQTTINHTTEEPISASSTTTTTTAATPKEQIISSTASPSNDANNKQSDVEVSSSTARNQQESITVLSSVAAADVANKVNIKREYLFSLEGLPLLNVGYHNENVGAAVAPPVEEPETAGSNNVYHVVLTTDAPSTPRTASTEGSSVVSDLPSSTEGYSIETTEGPEMKQTSSGVSTTASTIEAVSEMDMNNSTQTSTEATALSAEAASSPRPTTDGIHEDDDATLPVESNPAYPSLPEDDFSLRDDNFPLSESDVVGELDEPRSIGGGAQYKKINSKPYDAESIIHIGDSSSTTDGSGDGDFSDMSSSTVSSITESSMPAKFALLQSSREDSSEEIHISNATDFLEVTKQSPIIKEHKSVDTNVTDDSLESESSECTPGSGSDCNGKQLNNNRESTTARAIDPSRTTERDIDDLASGSGDGHSIIDIAEDPKLDAESLKIDENDENGIATINAPTKSSVLNIVRTNPAQDKTIVALQSPVDVARVEGSGRLQLHRVFI